MDGTLIDSSAVITGLWRKWARRHGFDAEAILRASPGRRAIETVALFASPGMDVEAEATRLAVAAGTETEGVVAIPGALALLQSLPLSRWAVVTSAERFLAKRWLTHTGLPCPDILVAAEDVTIGKPDPAGYLLAAERLGLAAERTVVFEDAPSGIAAGKAAGATVVALATALQPPHLDIYPWIRDFSGVSWWPDEGGVLRFS